MGQALRRRTYEILDIGRADDRLSRLVDFGLIGLISLNVLAVVLESVPSLAAGYAAQFAAFETVSVAVFSVEYLARVWAAADDSSGRFGHPVWGRLRYMCTPMALIDLAVILPFYLMFFIDLDLRFLRVLRLLRVFKLTRYSASMGLLLGVLRDEARSIAAALFVLFLLIIMAASLVYLAEHEAQPDKFGSIPAAMWWAIITMTTVGYGDVTPITAVGKTFGAAISIVSVGMVALPAGLLASGFTEALRRRRRRFEGLVDAVLEDGHIDAAEAAALAHTRELLGIGDEEAAAILAMGRRRGPAAALCPHCGEPLEAARPPPGAASAA